MTCVAAVVPPSAAGSDACPPGPKTLTTAEVKKSLAAVASATDPKAVKFNGVCIDGPLRLPGTVNGAFVLRNSTITGGLSAESTVFRSIIDLTGSTITGPASFSSAEFDRGAEFNGTVFVKPASFTAAAFGAPADFTSASFIRSAVFDNAELADQSRFTDANFGALASFLGVHFGGGTDFTHATFLDGTQFNLSTAQGDLGFQDACFRRGPSFEYVLYSGTTDFSGAQFADCQGTITTPVSVDFTDSVVASLNLRAGTPEPVSWTPPKRVDELEINSSLIGRTTSPSVYGALGTAARHADDLAAANEAAVLRLGRERHSMPVVVRQLDWAFAWGVGGYLVRPLHPAVALLVLFGIGVLVRAIAQRRKRRGPRGVFAGLVDDADGAFRSFKKITPDRNPKAGDPPRSPKELRLLQLEVVLYTVLTLVLVVNLESVSPSIRNLVEGLL